MNYPKWPFYTHTRSLPPSRIIRSNIRDSLIVEGSDINGAHISNSIIGMRSIIREHTRLEGVVMMGSDFYEGEQVLRTKTRRKKPGIALGIGKDCSIERAIIDKNVRIGNNVVIRAKPTVESHNAKNYYIKDGVTIIPKGAIIKSGTRI